MRSSFAAWMLALVACLALFAAAPAAYAVDECTPLAGTNVSYQNYSRTASPVYSYLTTSGDGYMRVQGSVSDVGIVAVYYDSDFNLKERRVIDAELPLFGGFYETSDNYFIVSGQLNSSQESTCEVYRITKYDKSWNRLGSCGLFGANTTIPFRAGSCRLDSTGKYLVVRTCHQMYTSEDGVRHQANVTILVDTQEMNILDSYTGISNSSCGYVSHSFNQFVKLENGKIVSVDHGDAYPRSICLMRYPTDVTTGSFQSYNVGVKHLLSFPGTEGNNTTGASVGAFEISSSSYLVAGNSVIQDDQNTSRSTRNVFVASVNKATGEGTRYWFTEFEEGEESASTPHLVKVSDERFLLLWERSSKVYYTLLDDAGRAMADLHELEGNLSDCVPVVVNGRAVWYTWRYGEEKFYSISVDDLDDASVTARSYDHDYQWMGTADGLATMRCSKCGDEVTGKVPSSFMAFWRATSSEDSYYYTNVPAGLEAGDSVMYLLDRFKYSATSDNYYADVTIEAEDPEACTVNMDTRTITFNKVGTYKIFAYPTYNPDVRYEYTFVVVGSLQSVELAASAASPQKYGTAITLTAASKGGKGALSYEFVQLTNAGSTVLRAGATSNTFAWNPPSAGSYRLQVNVTDAGDDNKLVASNVVDYVIEPAPLQTKGGASVAAASSIVYGQKASEIPVTDAQFVSSVTGEDVAGAFSFDNPNEVLSAGVHEVAYTFTPESANFLPVTGTLQATVEKAPVQVIAAPTVESFTYHPSKTLADRALVGGETSTEGTWQWDDPTAVATVPGGTYACTFIPTDSNNFEVATANVAVTVSKAVPVVASVQASGITYGQTLADSTLQGEAQYALDDDSIVEGTLRWVDTSIAPQVLDSNATAYAIKFEPANSGNYEKVQATTTLSVSKAAKPPVVPSASYNVAYSVDRVSNDILANAEGWEFSPADIGKTLELGKVQNLVAHYVAEGAGNYEMVETTIAVKRSTCEHASTEVRNAKDATCNATGYSGDVYCSACEALLEPGHELEALGHAWASTYTIDKPATYDEEGSESIHCERCGIILEGSQRAIAKLQRPTPEPGVVSPETPAVTSEVESQVVNAKSDDDQEGSLFGLLQAKGIAKSKKAVRLSWNTVPSATEYIVYGNKCGKKNKMQKLATVTGNAYTQKKLKKGAYYKYLVIATNGDSALALSKTVHVATKGGKVGNSKSVTTKADAGGVVLAQGGTFKLGAKAQAQSAKLKVKKHRAIAYETSNQAVASVSKKGVITANAAGTCTVYAYAQNGVSKAVQVTVG